MEKTIFSSAGILLPKFSSDPAKMSKWAVIACDQFTSEPEYWDKCRELISGESSAYDYIMPEAYLETEIEDTHNAEIEKNMNDFEKSAMDEIDGLLYIERTLPNGALIVKHILLRQEYIPKTPIILINIISSIH